MTKTGCIITRNSWYVRRMPIIVQYYLQEQELRDRRWSEGKDNILKNYKCPKQDLAFYSYILSNRMSLNAQREEWSYNVQNMWETDWNTNTEEAETNIKPRKCITYPQQTQQIRLIISLKRTGDL